VSGRLFQSTKLKEALKNQPPEKISEPFNISHYRKEYESQDVVQQQTDIQKTDADVTNSNPLG